MSSLVGFLECWWCILWSHEMNFSWHLGLCDRTERDRCRSTFDCLCAVCLGADGQPFVIGGLEEPLKCELEPWLVFSEPHWARLYIWEGFVDHKSHLIHFVMHALTLVGGLVGPSGKVHCSFAGILFEVLQFIDRFMERRWSRISAKEVLNCLWVPGEPSGPWPVLWGSK